MVDALDPPYETSLLKLFNDRVISKKKFTVNFFKKTKQQFSAKQLDQVYDFLASESGL